MRLIDWFVALIGLLILSPIFLIIAFVIKFTSVGPVFYLAQRIGKGSSTFHLYKFRSMVVNADKQGPGITISGDSRVTPIGRFLRRYKIDELPQLVNVFKGEMSLVGPRPESPYYVSHYTPEQRQVLTVRPGITSAASLAYRHEEQLLAGKDWETTYLNEIMPAKLAIDLEYVKHRTVWTDIKLVLRTILAMFQSEA